MTRVEIIKHVDGVRARWLGAHADPTINPAWANAERDIGLLLQDYAALAADLTKLEHARDRLLSACEDSDDAQYGTLSTTFVQHCFATQTE
jgi:hypothetical protein